jgi:asparagine synthase (glutamine-hydrolysing)
MTALAGLLRFDGRPDAADGCRRMLASQELYGPHAVAQWSEAGVALGRRLMRVLPEDAFDRQPLSGGNGRYRLVADVRLDNRDELAEILDIPISQARTQCDAAILLAAIERWDERCVEHLLGNYAFACWDSTCRRLLLARDPLGLRPLHYHRGNGFLAFASMPKGLHALADVPYAPDEERILAQLMKSRSTGSRTHFRAIERVEPGHIVTITSAGLQARRHWQPPRRRIALAGPEEYAEALRELLDRAVRCRLRGTGDVGAQLSGGLDSSAVTATAARLLAPANRRIVAFTAVPRQGYDGPVPRHRIGDEGPNAAATAALYPNVEHVLIRGEGRSPLDDLDRGFFLYDAPVPSLSNVGWLFSIYDAARERKLKILLTGARGNIGLSYEGLHLLPELLRSGRLLRWWREARALVGAGGARWRGVLARSQGPWCPGPLWLWLNEANSGFSLDFGAGLAVNPLNYSRSDRHRRMRDSGKDPYFRPGKDGFEQRLSSLFANDQGNYLKGLLGGWHIDERDPTGDVRLLEFCLAVPTEQYFCNGKGRALARRALADRLPRVLLDESRRGLQGADWHERLTAVRDGVAAELDRLAACPPAARLIDLPRLRQLVDNWPDSGWERSEVTYPYRAGLLRAISAGHFLRRATGANS